MRTLPLLAIALIIPLAARDAAGQTVRGRVVDAASGEGVPEAQVSALGQDNHATARTRTHADGTFSITLRVPGTFQLRGERTGYAVSLSRQVEVAARETVTVALRLSSQATAIDPLTVTARAAPPHKRALELNGFYEREASGFGRFLRREDIDRVGSTNMVNVLAAVPGVDVQVDRRGNQVITFGRSRITGSISRAQQQQSDLCMPTVYLDGVRVGYDRGDRREGTSPDINQIVSKSQLEAVELYRSTAELPPQYGGSGASCGVILFWTRRDLDDSRRPAPPPPPPPPSPPSP
jgi:hypothetical protein